jgi:hypothetical protein
MASGIMQILVSYIIRRGTGNELNDTYIIFISADSIYEHWFSFKCSKLGYALISYEL